MICWVGLLRRCYSDKLKEKHPTYQNCTVCEEWHNYQVFAKWYEDNYYNIEGQRMELDKDILYKGNKIYSPETCVFVPRIINTVILNRQRDRGKYPVGVTYSKRQNMFLARCSDGFGQMTCIGRFSDPINAFNAYKNYKENFIKHIADEYKEAIPNKLYEAMYRYKVEITD